MENIRTLSEYACFGGTQSFYEHDSSSIGLPMRFGVYKPPQAQHHAVPTLLYLAGLTCNEETFAIKAGAQRMAAELGLAIVTPDTSPRGANIEGESDAWDFGLGAGFYVDATQSPWAKHWQMCHYLTQELHALLVQQFEADAQKIGIFGHSMGGHGALTLALNHPNLYRSVSAFAPISAPSQCPWGVKAFTGYLGSDPTHWGLYDATELVKQGARTSHILIDQGTSDKFLTDQLHPHLFEKACLEAGQSLTLRYQPGYDHGYYFIASFVADHLRHHAQAYTQF
jgi:S-formylglutathione hydrolase